MSVLSIGLLALLSSAPTLLVLPPDTPAGDAAAARAAEAVSDLLPHALAFLGVPAVQRADRLLALEQLEIPQTALTRATSIRVAEALLARRLVVGSLELAGADVVLTLRLLDSERGAISAPFKAQGGRARLPEIVDSLAFDLALASARPGKERAELFERRRPPPLEALDAYAHGLEASEAKLRVRWLRQALRLGPAFDEARLELGRLLLATREYQAAYDTLAAVQTAGLTRRARFLQGRALLDLGRYDEAHMLYAGLAASEPSAAVLNNHALALLRLPRPPPRASELLRRALELCPGDADIAFNLGFALLAEGEPAPAAFWLQGVVRGSARDTRARAVLSWALRRSGKPEEADEVWRAAIALSPSLGSLASEDLSRRFERVAPSERRPLANESARSHAELAAAHLGRAERGLQSGDLELAERELSMAAFSDPYNARVHARLAHVLRERGDLDKAVSELRIALWCRDDPELRVELARLLRLLGREAEARAEAALALKADPTSASARELAAGK